ncbi:MAG: UDP-N-acetylglucosamine 2-epimerase (non-hydrolyzing) [archaeon]
MAIVGVRPQIIKAAPLLHILKRMRNIELQLIHTGQHYDYEMSRVFFEDLDLPDPLSNLGAGSGSQARQTARMMIRIEDMIGELQPDTVIVFGDANTTLAGALSGVKIGVRIAHVEAGLRSGDMSMAEEINRILVDHCAHLLFAPTETAARNLCREGIPGNRIRMCGDTMVDSMVAMKAGIDRSEILTRLGLEPDSYVALTTHRAENVDNRKKLQEIITGAGLLKSPVVFPVHPRTKRRMADFGLRTLLAEASNIMLTKPLGYLDMLQLTQQSRLLLTDSGGMQKEAFLLHVPCLTIRNSTEWVETLRSGANRLIPTESKRIRRECERILKDKRSKTRLGRLPSPFGDGSAASRIVKSLLR